jgi:hypothetical protein
VRRGKVLLAQSYLSPGDLRARGFVLGSYLLIKGSHTFVNMDIGSAPSGSRSMGSTSAPALAPAPASVDALGALGADADTRGWRWRLFPVRGRLALPAEGVAQSRRTGNWL